MKKLTVFLWALPTFTFFMAFFFLWQSLHPAHSLQFTGKNLPYFDAPLLSDPAKQLTPNSFKGKVVLLNFWASWCPACRNEHALLMKIKEKYGVMLYGINYRDNPEKAERYLKIQGNPYVSVGQDNEGFIADQFQLYGTPETFLIDAKGVIRYHFTGTLTQEEWESKIWPLIQKISSKS